MTILEIELWIRLIFDPFCQVSHNVVDVIFERPQRLHILTYVRYYLTKICDDFQVVGRHQHIQIFHTQKKCVKLFCNHSRK